MKNRILIFAATTGLLTACVEMNKSLRSDWSNNMQGLAGSYSKLIPFLYTDGEFTAPKNKARIMELVEQVKSDAKTLSPTHQKQLLGDDPIYVGALKELKQVSSSAHRAFSSAQYEHAKYLLKNSILFCAQCHTQSRRGPEIIQWDNFADIKTVNPIEKSRVFLATRQYQKASDIMSNYVNSSPLPADKELIPALKHLIQISLRENDSPMVAVEKIERIQKSRHYSTLLRPTRLLIASWKASLKNWSKAKELQKLPPLATLVQSSDSGRFVDDRGFIVALRNSEIYHQALKQRVNYDHKPIIYQKLGLIYDRYPGLSAWGVPEHYFKACINLRPHTPIAIKCYKSLKLRIKKIHRFIGDASLPLEAKQSLNYYKALSVEGPRLGSPRSNFYNK